jgi:hypothetical protein
LKYVPLGRARCIPKSKAFSSFTGVPSWWSEVLFVCVLRPALARGLPSRASVVIWVFFSRELVGLNFPSCLRIRLLWRFTAFAVRQNRKKCLYLGHIAEFERFVFFHVSLKPKITRVAFHDAQDTNKARGLKKRRARFAHGGKELGTACQITPLPPERPHHYCGTPFFF